MNLSDVAPEGRRKKEEI